MTTNMGTAMLMDTITATATAITTTMWQETSGSLFS